MMRILFIALVAFFASGSWAGPAAWYKWRSVLSNNDVCAQFSPGPGWVRVLGPFEDAACRKPGVPH